MTASTQTHKRERVPDYQNGGKAIVLGAREGNIGGAIAERLCRMGWIAMEDDCYRPIHDGSSRFLEEDYAAPTANELSVFDACVITLGTTHMEPFSEVRQLALHEVLYGSLELPLECARRYVHGRKEYVLRCHVCRYQMDSAGALLVCGQCGTNRPAERAGTIVFIGSYAHNHPFTHCTSYCVAKAGLDMACKSLAWELMPEGFDVHIIHPHHVQGTPMTEEVRQGMMNGVHKMTPEQAEEYSRKDLRMPDLLKPSEVADMVGLILGEPVMRWLSGRSIEMFGGVR